MTRFLKNKFSYLAPRDSSERSLIPYAFSLALCVAMEQQKPPLTLSYFIDLTLSEPASGSGKSTTPEECTEA